ncbi:MAG: hypothetical protein FJY29_04355 [Betaproteobacteria bacterium]|nr:hypothetical protein [Betaproteobacteria bacterium]
MGSSDEKPAKRDVARATPLALSQQLGVPVYDVLAAIESAHLEPLDGEGGLLEYEIKPVVSSLLENKRLQQSAENPHVQRLLRECLETYQDALRRMIREENKTAYEIKQMTESRFLEVLGQLSISLGRLEAFVAQSSRVLSQIDVRLSRLASGQPQQSVQADSIPSSQPGAEGDQLTQVAKTLQHAFSSARAQLRSPVLSQLTQQEHWLAFESHLTQVLMASGQTSESARTEWFEKVKVLLHMGSLELRLNGQAALADVRPALVNQFSELLSRMPSEQEVLPGFEVYFDWVQAEMRNGYPALLLFLLIVLNRGAQVSWSGFLSTFVNES